MTSVAPVVEGKRIVICAGSGGVGKTTTAAALAMGMAERGQKVAVVTIDPAKRLADALGLDQSRLVAELLEAERVRQPPRRVDGHDGDLRAVGRRAHRERGGGRGLAHAAGAGAHHDPAAGQQLRDRGGQMSPSRTACATACERERALSFVTTSCSTFFTVRSE